LVLPYVLVILRIVLNCYAALRFNKVVILRIVLNCCAALRFGKVVVLGIKMTAPLLDPAKW
jgi:hypothetical protein